MRARAALRGALLAGAVALASCGGSAAEAEGPAARDYVRAVDAQRRALVLAFAAVQDRLGTTATSRELGGSLDAFAVAAQRGAAAVRAIRPPAAAAAGHRALAGALAGYGRSIAAVRDELSDAPDGRAALVAATRLQDAAAAAQDRIDTARRQIDGELGG